MGNWIVVVDDEALSLTGAKTLLGSEDMKISCLRSGRELLKFMEKNEPDLILLDVMMPEMDGFETLEKLRSAEKAEGKFETPVIFLTGDMDEATEQRGLKLGASDYIHKPFNKDILIRRIKNVIINSRRIESLTEDATIDKLTGFLNKSSGVERIADVCGSASGVFMILDLDNFKLVNDLFGHDIGDRFLASFSSVFGSNIRSNDIVCRIGGDEFMAFFNSMKDDDSIQALTDRLNDQLIVEAAKLMGEDHCIPIGISIGAVYVPDYGREYESLFKLADDALYMAKHRGKHCCYIYNDRSIESGEDISPQEELARITKIIEERNDGGEATLLTTDAFTAVYRFLKRFNMRYDFRAVKLLFVIKAKENGSDVSEDMTLAFLNTIRKNIGRSDVIMQNKTNEFVILFPMADEAAARVIADRIIKAWEETEGCDSASIEYAMETC